MFTGIISDVGRIVSVDEISGGIRTRIATSYAVESIEIGASIACGGPCHTVVNKGGGISDCWFEVESTTETLSVTTVGQWQPGDRVNLERSLRMGDELGGHLVTGHIDATAVVLEEQTKGDAVQLRLGVPDNLMGFIAPKGSIALDGTSLTVNEVEGETFTVMLIPHTREVTTWSDRHAGDRVNLEVDMMARYAARLTEIRG